MATTGNYDEYTIEHTSAIGHILKDHHRAILAQLGLEACPQASTTLFRQTSGRASSTVDVHEQW